MTMKGSLQKGASLLKFFSAAKKLSSA